MAGDEVEAVDAAVRSYARRMVDLDAELERLRDRDAWRTYAAAALTGLIAGRVVPAHESYRAEGLACAAGIADDMLELERARFAAEGGGDGHAPR